MFSYFLPNSKILLYIVSAFSVLPQGEFVYIEIRDSSIGYETKITKFAKNQTIIIETNQDSLRKNKSVWHSTQHQQNRHNQRLKCEQNDIYNRSINICVSRCRNIHLCHAIFYFYK